MRFRLASLILLASLIVLCALAPFGRVQPRPAPPDPRAVLAELEKNPERGKSLADGWRAFVDPRTGLAADSAVADNARRLLLAWAVKERGTRDWQRLIGLAADVEARLSDEARANWARIVLPLIPAAAEGRAKDEAKDVLDRLRRALGGEKPVSFNRDNPGALTLASEDSAVFLSWLAVRSYTGTDLPPDAASAVNDAIFPLLWGAARKLPAPRLRELALTVDRLLKPAEDRDRQTWRDWSVPVVLQAGRESPALVGGPDDDWKPQLDRVAAWVRDKEADQRFGWTPEGKLDQTGFLRANDVLSQPDNSGLPGDHPLVLAVMVEPLKAALKDKGLSRAPDARRYVEWLWRERAVRDPDTAAAVAGFLVRVFDPQPAWFEVEAGRGEWKFKLTGDAKTVRDALTSIVEHFDAAGPDVPWYGRFGPAFVANPVLTQVGKGVGEQGLRAAGRVRLLKQWGTFASEAEARAREVQRAPVPAVTLPVEVKRLTLGVAPAGAKKSEEVVQLEKISGHAPESEKDFQALDRVVRNPWCQPWLLSIPADRRSLTHEEQARWRQWCRGLYPPSVRFAAADLWPKQFAAARQAGWKDEPTFAAWAVLRELPWAMPEYSNLLNDLTAEAAVEARGATEVSGGLLTRLAFVCRVGVPDTKDGQELLKRLDQLVGDAGPLAACRLLAFAAAFAPREPGVPAGPALARPAWTSKSKLAEDVEAVLSPGRAGLKAFEFRAAADAVRTLVSACGPDLDLIFPPNAKDGVRGRLGAALQPTRDLILESDELLPCELPLLVDAARLGNWSAVNGTSLAEKVGPADLSRAPLASVEAAVVVLGRVWDEDRQADRLSIAPPRRSPAAEPLLRLARREVGALCLSLSGERPLPTLLVATRTGGYLPEWSAATREPWWDLTGWDRLVYEKEAKRQPKWLDFPKRHPEIARLLSAAAEQERRWAPAPHDPARAAGAPTAAPAADALPERPFAVVREELDRRLRDLNQLHDDLKAGEASPAEHTLETIRDAIQANLRFNLTAAAERVDEAVAELRAAENRLEAARNASLAAEAQALAADLFARAAALKAKQAAFEVEVQANNQRKARLTEEIRKIQKDIADKKIDKAGGEVKIAELDKQVLEVRKASLSRAIAVLKNEIEIVETALFQPIVETHPDTGAKVECAGQVGVLAFKAEIQVNKYIDQLKKAADDSRERLKKIREGNCIKAVTRVIGSICCLIPGAGPFIGMGIIAAGEIAAGIHTGKSFGEIAVGLIDNALDIAKQAGFDAEKELNKVGEKLGAKADGVLKDVDSRLGPVLKRLPLFLDKNVLKVALDAAGLKGDARKLFEDLGKVLQEARADTSKLGKLGTILTTAGREAAVTGATPEQLLENLKGKLKEEFVENGRLYKSIQAIKGDVNLFGEKVENLKNNPERLAEQFGKLVLAQCARGMADHRDRVLSNFAMALTGLQARLRAAGQPYGSLAQLVQTEFEKDAELKRILDEVIEQIPEAQKVLKKAPGGGYEPLAWDEALKPVAEEVLAKLLPGDPAGRAEFVERLRLHADPSYASDKLAAAVRPWQTSLQQKLAKVEDKLNQPSGGGDEEQQLTASIQHVEDAKGELETKVLGWLRQDDTPERGELRKRLTELRQKLQKEEDNLKVNNLQCEQAEVRIRIAEAEVEIARQQAVIARLAGEKAAIDVSNADLKKWQADLEKQIKDFEGGGQKKLQEAALDTLRQRRAERDAAEADVVAATHRVRARRAELAFADRQPAADLVPLPNNDRRVLLAAYERKLDQACASARELLRMLEWVKSPVKEEFPLPSDRMRQLDALGRLSQAIDSRWDEQNFDHEWIQTIDLDGRTRAGRDMIRRLFSGDGVLLRIIPGAAGAGPNASGAVWLGPEGIVKEHGRWKNARIIAVTLFAGGEPEARGTPGARMPLYPVPPQSDWTRSFVWRGTAYEPAGDSFQALTPPNARSIREAPMFAGDKEKYTPYSGKEPLEGSDLIPASGAEGHVLRRGGFLPPPGSPTGPDGLPAFLRLTDNNALQTIEKLDRMALDHYKVNEGSGMKGLNRSRTFQEYLGPPLYGEHWLRVLPDRQTYELFAKGERPIQHVRICILYLYNAQGNPK